MSTTSGEQRCRIAGSPELLLNPFFPCFLATAAGAKFFPGFVNDKRRAALDAAALSWQADGRSRLKVLDRMSVAEHHAALLPAQAAGGLLLQVAATGVGSFVVWKYPQLLPHVLSVLSVDRQAACVVYIAAERPMLLLLLRLLVCASV